MNVNFFENLKTIFASGFWQFGVFGNTVADYFAAIGVFAALLVVFKIFQTLVLRRLKKLAEQTKTDIDDTLIEIVKSIRPSFYSFLSFYVALNFLNIESMLRAIIYAVLIIWAVYQVIAAVQILINYIARKTVEKEGGEANKSPIIMIGKLSKAVLWMLGVLLVLSNLGIDITSLIAGLGIGGVAIALALQNILTDLFSSFAIYFDKPFKTGDFIITGNDMGVVEKIGIKTTRIRTLQGQELVISNRELTEARINNYKRMEKRRISFGFGVTYDTSTEKLKKIPNIIKNIIEKEELAQFDRAHFKEYGDFSLNYEVVYYVNVPDYNSYMDTQQSINLSIKEAFDKEGIEFAYPTQTVYLTKS